MLPDSDLPSSSSSISRIIITGASGVLGSAIRNVFATSTSLCYSSEQSKSNRLDDHIPESTEWRRARILALSHTRSGEGFFSLDLTQKAEVERVFSEFRPNWVIHCAAERRPDVAQKDPAQTTVLNTEVPCHLAQLSESLDFTLLYISTDYVFDGTSPPYKPASPTNPLQFYGRTKRDGEQAVLSVPNASVFVLRVPVLYGPAPSNSDSAINILLDVVRDQSGKKYEMDHWATRYPTNVCDIARFIVRLLGESDGNGKQALPPILHYSANEPYTKYEICLVFARILGLSYGHIVPASGDAGAGTNDITVTTRPKDCRLDTKETEVLCSSLGIGDLGEGGLLGLCQFEQWWREYLQV